jgi:inosose dehydratase
MIKVANAPCSWGVLEFDGLEGEAAGYAQVLDEMRETGYDGTELGDWGFMPIDPAALKDELARRKLTMLGAFVPVALANPDDHDRGVKAAVRTAHLLSAVGGRDPFIVLADDNVTDPMRTQNAGRVTPEMGLTADQWRTYTAGAEKVARAVREETGLRTVFHHHCAGFVETPAEVQTFLELTDPELIGLCFDTGHYRFGGGDPLAGLRRHAGRIWHVHFKDCQPEVAARSRAERWDYLKALHHGVFCELGKGDVDFPAVLRALREMGYEGWIVVEQDVLPGMGRPKESAKRNRLYLSNIGI